MKLSRDVTGTVVCMLLQMVFGSNEGMTEFLCRGKSGVSNNQFMLASRQGLGARLLFYFCLIFFFQFLILI